MKNEHNTEPLTAQEFYMLLVLLNHADHHNRWPPGTLDLTPDGPWQKIYSKCNFRYMKLHKEEANKSLHKEVSRNWQEELEHDNAAMRVLLRNIRDVVLDNSLPDAIKVGNLMSLLDYTEEPKVVPLREVAIVLNALVEFKLNSNPMTWELATKAVTAFQTKYPSVLAFMAMQSHKSNEEKASKTGLYAVQKGDTP